MSTLYSGAILVSVVAIAFASIIALEIVLRILLWGKVTEPSPEEIDTASRLNRIGFLALAIGWSPPLIWGVVTLSLGASAFVFLFGLIVSLVVTSLAYVSFGYAVLKRPTWFLGEPGVSERIKERYVGSGLHSFRILFLLGAVICVGRLIYLATL